jgi:hypothetical protein
MRILLGDRRAVQGDYASVHVQSAVGRGRNAAAGRGERLRLSQLASQPVANHHHRQTDNSGVNMQTEPMNRAAHC